MNPTQHPTAAPAATSSFLRLAPIDRDDNCRQRSTSLSDERYTFQDGKLAFSRDPEPRMLPGLVEVQVGPLTFELRGVIGPLLHPRDNGPCNGLCYTDQLVIVIDFNSPPDMRRAYIWHELAHAMLAVFNVGEREQLDEESVCDALAVFMAGISPEKYAEIVAFVNR